MFRLTVGRRLGLVMIVAIGAITVITWLVLRSAYGDSDEQRVDDLASIVDPLGDAIESMVADAASRLEYEAASLANGDATEAITRLRETGFIAVDLVASDSAAPPIEVTSNFLQRAAAGPAIGSTRLFSGRVGLVMGAPVPRGDRAGEVLVGLYDVSDIIGIVRAAQTGDSTEALLAVRNTEGDVVIFTPSRHNGGRPIGPVGPTTAELVAEALATGEDVVDTTIAIGGRDTVAVLVPIESPRWVLVGTTDPVQPSLLGIPWWLLPAFGGVALLALIPILILRRRLREVVRGAQQISRGRLTQRLDDDTDDEIGLLSRTLQALDERLQSDTEQRGRSAALLKHQATHDPLTGLANRSRLMEELSTALNRRDAVALLFCDIDDFKGINDLQGHEGGDVVLKHVANQLASVCGPTELLARFGGDEFCVLARREPAEARELTSRVERALDTSCLVNGTQQKIAGSVGLALAKVTDTADSILKSADLAMYREKERRRGLRRAGRDQVEAELISPEQIRLVYQPVVELIEQRIIGVEVLARYMHPEMGLLDPSSFLPPGTERGVFDKFDLEILTRSIDQLSEWLEQGVVDERFTMSLNLSPDHISDSVSTRQIFEIVRQRRVPPAMLQIEVTEHRLHAHEDDLVNSLDALRERGIKIAIDDFGIEGSNVDRLVQIPSDVVKIDRSFVSDIDIDDRAENRLRAIVEIVTTEGLTPIAEGVERSGQARVLRHIGVPYGQGYLWHAPITALALTPLLGRASRWSRKKPAPQRD